jgi:hypothetical protein
MTLTSRTLLILLGATLLMTAPARAEDTRQRISAARESLDGALQRLRLAPLMTVADRQEREDILQQSRHVLREADVTRRRGGSLDALLAELDTLRDRALGLADDAVAETTGEPSPPPPSMRKEMDPDPLIVINVFHDVVGNAIAVQDRLTGDERTRLRDLRIGGEDLVHMIEDIRNTDHVARLRQMDSLRQVTEELRALQQAGLRDRTHGRWFIPADHVPQGWLAVGENTAGFESVRVAFEKPRTARLWVRNTSEEAKPFFVEMEFFDVVAKETGTAAFESAPREELKPGEIREIVVPISPVDRFFWDTTRTFTVSVQ